MKSLFTHPFSRLGVGLLFSVLLLVMVSCDDYDKWTTSPSARLTFSADTVSFDTVIATHSSPTQTLLVFNHNEKGLRINNVALKGGSSSLFRVNVDGQYLYGGAGSDFDVRGEDSIFVRIEVQLPASESDEVQHYEDRLVFSLESGTQQSVLLVADGQDVYTMQAPIIQRDTTLRAGRPYLIYDSLVVAQGATLTLEPGVTLMFHDGVPLNVHGRLVAQGTMEQPVVFRGDRLDRLFDYLPYDNTPERWGGIHIFGESTGNVMEQCDVHSGDYGILCDSVHHFDVDNPMLRLTNSVVHNVAGPGLQAYCTVVEAVGTQLSNSYGPTLSIVGGASQFVHCTVAQYYPWVADRGDALYLANRIDMSDEGYRPITYARFLNCVITGYAEDVIMGDILDPQDEPCRYLFSHCLLRTVKSDDEERFVNIIYDNEDLEPNGSDHFVNFDTKNFLYDFTPDSLSSIIGLADPAITQQFSPFDRRGRSRMADGKPDAGAFEWVSSQP